MNQFLRNWDLHCPLCAARVSEYTVLKCPVDADCMSAIPTVIDFQTYLYVLFFSFSFLARLSSVLPDKAVYSLSVKTMTSSSPRVFTLKVPVN